MATETISIVRQNLLNDKNYAPYCGECRTMERMKFNNDQFVCKHCNSQTNFDSDFILKLIKFRTA